MSILKCHGIFSEVKTYNVGADSTLPRVPKKRKFEDDSNEDVKAKVPKTELIGTPSSETFDLTLMICLIKNLTKIQIEDELPFRGNDNVGAHLTTIKYYRNKIIHSSNRILIDLTFNKWWDETSKAIIQLGGMSFTERCRLAKERRMDRNDREILTEMRNMIGKIEPVPKGVRDVCNRRILESKKENVAHTRAMKRLTELVELHNVALAVGHPVAENLLQYILSLCKNPEEMKYFYDPDRTRIVIMENVVGDKTFDENKAMKWLELTKDIRVMLDKACCDFLASDYCLTNDERLNIANFYLTKDEIRLLKSSNVFSEFDYFPLLCQYYSRQKSGGVVEFFADPTEAVCADLSRLELFDQTALATLFLFVVCNNNIAESLFTEKIKIKPILENIADHFDLKSNFSIQAVKNKMVKLNNSYIRKRITEFSIIHDKIFDIYVNFFGRHMIDLTIDIAYRDIIRDNFVFNGLFGKFHKNELVVKIPLDKEQKYFDRLKKDIDNGFIRHVFANRNLQDSSFRSKFITQIVIANDKIDSLSDKVLFSIIMSMLDKKFYDIVAIFLTKEIQLNQLYSDGETPLFKAAKTGCTDVVQELLNQNADPNFHACFSWLNNVVKTYPGVTVTSIFKTINTALRYSPPFLFNIIFPVKNTFYMLSQPFTSSAHYRVIVKSYLDDSSSNIQSRVNRYEPYRVSPLHIASQIENTDIVKLLLSHNALPDYNPKCHKIASLMFTASSKGYTDIVHLLLENKLNFDVTVSKSNTLNMNGFSQLTLESFLYKAVEKGHYEVVKLLLNNHTMEFCQCHDHLSIRSPKTEYNKHFVFGNMVAVAILKDYIDIVQLLLEKDCITNFRDVKDVSILFKAICEEDNFSPNIVLENNESPLYRAGFLGHIEIVKVLLEYKSNPNTCKFDGKSPLFRASWEGHTEIVKLLLEHNSKPDITDYNGTSHEIDINVYNVDHKSPLFIATEYGQNEIVALLLKHNCNPNICDDSKTSPLMLATQNGDSELVKLLLEHNSNPNVCNKNKESPLFEAAQRGHSTIVNLLLDNNYDINLCNIDNELPLHVASRYGFTEIVQRLQNHK
ncbi:unnamed protein product [Mytilus coruscus]|uniref:DZIP3-like HEPN domain-containing protein n=1 Tax=Mytilus coruscus TaxID=42192 RepID=A0A6J8C1A7_MYTCO|nr:unnamed protein product [Mytilus coruscus]